MSRNRAKNPRDETSINLRAYSDLIPDAKLKLYRHTWTDEQTIAWDKNFRDDGYLMLLCCDRDVDVHEYREYRRSVSRTEVTCEKNEVRSSRRATPLIQG